jgi:low temperature requirement protein LtrA
VAEEPGEKRVSWVELYFDLIFAFAVGETTHVMVAAPAWSGFGHALGLFLPLWWTWIGFVVLYNRHLEDQASQRLFVLLGTLPCAVAAVETHDAASGQGIAFALALAAARLVLALAFAFTSEHGKKVAIGYGVSAVVFAASAWVPSPWRYVLWAFTLIQEAGFLLLRNGERNGARDGERNSRQKEKRTRRTRTETLRAMLQPPVDPARRVDAAHLAERFGLMMIILMGEVVISVGASAVDVPNHDPRYWLGLLAGLVLAAALWWVYFTAAAPLNEYVLRASGGNPTLAYGIYAGGHLSPAFALLAMSAGVTLTLSGESPHAAAWLITGGLGMYVAGSQVIPADSATRFARVLRPAVIPVTICLAFLQPVISITGVVLVAALWAAGIAAYATWHTPDRLKIIKADPLTYFRSGAPD